MRPLRLRDLGFEFHSRWLETVCLLFVVKGDLYKHSLFLKKKFNKIQQISETDKYVSHDQKGIKD